jgi:hypothetical protein
LAKVITGAMAPMTQDDAQAPHEPEGGRDVRHRGGAQRADADDHQNMASSFASLVVGMTSPEPTVVIVPSAQ